MAQGRRSLLLRRSEGNCFDSPRFLARLPDGLRLRERWSDRRRALRPPGRTGRLNPFTALCFSVAGATEFFVGVTVGAVGTVTGLVSAAEVPPVDGV